MLRHEGDFEDDAIMVQLLQTVSAIKGGVKENRFGKLICMHCKEWTKEADVQMIPRLNSFSIVHINSCIDFLSNCGFHDAFNQVEICILIGSIYYITYFVTKN